MLLDEKVGAGELGARPGGTETTGRQFIGRLDRSAGGSIIHVESGRLSLRGWALAIEPLVEVRAYIAEVLAGTAKLEIERQAVEERYASILAGGHCGFDLKFNRIPVISSDAVDIVMEFIGVRGRVFRNTVRCTKEEFFRELSKPNQAVDAIHPIKLQIDTAIIDAAGVLRIQGWAASLSTVVKIQVHVDDDYLGSADVGKSRPDVGLLYKSYPNAAQSGFEFASDVKRFGEGTKRVRVEVLALGGVVRDVTVMVEAHKPDETNEPDSPFYAHCDDISLSTTGVLSVSGWAIARHGVDRLELFFAGEAVGTAEYGHERPDVGNNHPQIADSRASGFAFRRRIAKSLTGEFLLMLRVHDRTGAHHDVPLPVRAVETGEAFDDDVAASEAPLRLAIDEPAVVSGAASEAVRGALTIVGWAIAKAGVASIGVYIDGQNYGAAYYGVRREDVEAAFPDWPDTLLSGFALSVPGRAIAPGHHVARIVLTDKEGRCHATEFTFTSEEVAEATSPALIRRRMPHSEVMLKNSAIAATGRQPKFEIFIRTDGSKLQTAAARRTLESLRAQVYDNWRAALIVGSGSQRSANAARALAAEFGAQDRVTVLSRGDDGLEQPDWVQGDGHEDTFLGFVSAGDELGCDALLQFALDAAQDPTAALLYADDRRRSPTDGQEDAFFKPDWSPDLLLSTNYIGRAWFARASLLARTDATLAELSEAGDYGLVLRLTELARGARHLPHVLFRLEGAANDSQRTERQALSRALQRREISGSVMPGCAPGTHRIKRELVRPGLVSIIIPSIAARGLVETCLRSLREMTAYKDFEVIICDNIPPGDDEWKAWFKEHADKVVEIPGKFNWSQFNNLGAAVASGEYLLFLNDDIEVLEPNWLETLLENAQRPEVGVVGPQLLYPDRKVQHAGLFLSGTGTARHAFRFAQHDDPGYFGFALTQRNMIGVTGACLMVRTDVYDEVGGFDEAHSVINNDVDFCLRVQRAGYLVVYTPHTSLIHHELVSRAKMKDIFDTSSFVATWRDVFNKSDPYFHTKLSRQHDDYRMDLEPVRFVYAGHPVIDKSRVRNILVVKLDHIGDVITSLPAIRRLKQIFPDAKITLLAGKAAVSLAALEPAISEVVVFEFFSAISGEGRRNVSHADLDALQAELEPYRFDLAVDLRKHPDTREVLKHSGALFTAGFDFRGEMPWLDISLEWEGDTRFTPKRYHITDDLLHLVDAIGLASETDRSVIETSDVPPTKIEAVPARLYKCPIVCVHPAAGTEMRQWPPAYFAELIDRLIEERGANVAIIGAPHEQPITDEILKKVRNRRNVVSLIGKLKLAELPVFMRSCALYVGNNSGPQHMAAALGIPAVGIHSGVVDAAEWGPLGTTALAVQRQMSCGPCYKSKLEDCHRSLACLSGLEPREVFRACSILLSPS